MGSEERPTVAAFDQLNPKQQAFVLEYLECRVGAEAYKRAYSTKEKRINDNTAGVNANKLLRNAKIRESIRERLQKIWGEKEKSIGKIFDELSAIGFSDIRDLFVFHEDGTFSIRDLSICDTRAIKKIKIRKEPRGKDSTGEIIPDAEITEIELYDKRGALVDLAEIVDMKKAPTTIGQMITTIQVQGVKPADIKTGDAD